MTALAILLGLAIGVIVGAVGGGGAILALPVLIYVLDEPVGPGVDGVARRRLAGGGDRGGLAGAPRPRLLAAGVHVRGARRRSARCSARSRAARSAAARWCWPSCR